MAIEVRAEQAAPRRLAAIRSVTAPPDLRQTIARSLGIVWQAIREQGVRFGHNVMLDRR